MALTTLKEVICGTANNKRENLQISSKIKRKQERNLFMAAISTEYTAYERLSNQKYNKLKFHHHKKYLH